MIKGHRTIGRLKIAFPYLLFLAMAVLVVGSNLSPAPPSIVDPAGRAEAPVSPDHCAYCDMAVAPDAGVDGEVDGRSLRFCCGGCRARYLEVRAERGAHAEKRVFDPVCRMEVNPAWGFSSEHEGATFLFCTERCLKMFDADPTAYIGDRCMVCNVPVDPATDLPATYLGNTYYTCSEDHRHAFKADPASFFMHRMWGIPDWLYTISIALVLVISFVMFEGASAFRRWRGRPGSRESRTAGRKSTEAPGKPPRIDLMRFRPLRRLFLSRPFRFSVQLTMVAAFFLIIAAGLFGSQNPALNIAPILTWTIWWCALVILILFAGKAWCYACPWDAVAQWMEKLRLWRKTEKGGGLGIPWPGVARNIWLATILFVGLTWVELGFGVTMKPRLTAYLGLAMLGMAIVSAFLFEGKSFCRYGCLVGRVSGLYALFAGVEVRSRSRKVCAGCSSKECVHGSAEAYGCPTFEYPGTMTTNTYCIQCTECMQACPHDNLAVNLRPWGADLAVKGKPRSDEAYLALLMLSISSFHGLTMTPVWEQMIGAVEVFLPVGRIAAFSAAMVLLMGVPVAVYTVLVWLSHGVAVRSRPSLAERVPFREYFIRYAYCVLPIALFYHLAHNLEHLLMEGPKVVTLFSDPFGRGWNLLGTAGWTIPPIVSLDVLWILQVVLVAVGHVYSLWAAQRISRRIFTDPAAASRGQWPMLVGMIAFSILSLWLLKQPMEMRTSAM